ECLSSRRDPAAPGSPESRSTRPALLAPARRLSTAPAPITTRHAGVVEGRPSRRATRFQFDLENESSAALHQRSYKRDAQTYPRSASAPSLVDQRQDDFASIHSRAPRREDLLFHLLPEESLDLKADSHLKSQIDQTKHMRTWLFQFRRSSR